MTKKVEKEFLKRIEKAKLNNIFVQEEIKINSHIRGVYGFFAKKIAEMERLDYLATKEA